MDDCTSANSLPLNSDTSSSPVKNGSQQPDQDSDRGVKRSYQDGKGMANLPKVLKDMFGPLKCDLCGVSTNSTLTAYTHYKGKSHLKNVAKYIRENEIELETPLKKAKTEFVPTVCEICDVSLTSELQSLQHFSGKSHKKKVLSGEPKNVKVASDPCDPSGRFSIGKGFYTPLTNDASEQESEKPQNNSNENSQRFHCSTCSIYTTSAEALDAHYQGTKHKKKLSQQSVDLGHLSKYRTPSDYYYCPNCNVSANSAEQFQVHMKSKKHNAKKKETAPPAS